MPSALSILVASLVLTRLGSPRTGTIYALGGAVNAVGAALMAVAPAAAPFLLGVLIAGLGIPA